MADPTSRRGSALIQAAGKAQRRKSSKPASKAAGQGSGSKTGSSTHSTDSPRLLSGGNPQIPKGVGDAPVQAYIAAMPGWKRAVGKRLDELIEQAVPQVCKAVKWNSPLYGLQGQGWFLSLHCFTNYIKVAFFRGTSLHPMPEEGSRTPETRYLHISESAPLDEAQFSDWVQQASRLPGERM